MLKSWAIRLALLFVLTTHALLLAYSATRHSPVIDETGHLPAGLGHWRFGRFDLFAANPPLIRSWAVIPLLQGGFQEDWSGYKGPIRDKPELLLGREFVADNPDSFMTAFIMARWMCIPFSLLGAGTCYAWSKELFGQRAAWISLLLWCGSPTVLGHGSLMTPDTGAAALGVAACYVFRCWLRRPNWGNAICAGIVLGLVELTKFTWIALFLALPVVWLIDRLAARSEARPAWKGESVQLATLLLLGLYVVNIGYGFEGTMTPLGEFMFSSRALSGKGAEATSREVGNRFRGTWMGRVPVPLPKNMLLGIDLIKAEYENKYWSYLRGEHRHGGWWYYYLYAMLVKEPLGTWGLLLLALGVTIRRRTGRPPWREIFLLLFPAALIIGLVSSQTGFNHHLRYVLPAFPFLFIFASQAANLRNAKWKLLRPLPAACVVMAITSSLFTFPHSLSYFNEAVGGPRNGGQHLTFSNLDWGQDLIEVRDWYRAHPEARPLYVSATSFFEMRHFGIDAPSPRPTVGNPGSGKTQSVIFNPGWYVLGIDSMLQPNSDVGGFRRLVPTDRIGYSMHIFHLEQPFETQWPRIGDIPNPAAE